MRAELRFPKPPFRVEASLLAEPPSPGVLLEFLKQVRLWRSAVLSDLQQPGSAIDPEVQTLSEVPRKTFSIFLDVSWTEETTQYASRSPYNIRAFPVEALKCDPTFATLETVLDVLRWRAASVDYLADIPDTIYAPLDVEESLVLAQFLQPVSDQPLCLFCLAEFAEPMHPEAKHECLLLDYVRAKWPPLPAKFQAWSDEAKSKLRE